MRNILYPPFALLLLVHGAVSAEVKHISDFGFIVENRIAVSASKDDAWQSLTRSVDQWWPKDHTWWGDKGQLSIMPVAGGCFCEVFGDKQAEHMRISFVEPPSLLRMSGGLGPLQGMGMFGALDWRLQSLEDNHTQITLTYKVNGLNPEGFAQLAPIVDRVQSQQLSHLGAFLSAPRSSND